MKLCKDIYLDQDKDRERRDKMSITLILTYKEAKELLYELRNPIPMRAQWCSLHNLLTQVVDVKELTAVKGRMNG